MMVTIVGAALGAVLLSAGCKEPPTVLEVSIQVEAGVSIDAITVTARAAAKPDYQQTFEPRSVVTMRIQVEGLPDRTPVSVQAQGTRGGTVIVLQRAVIPLRAGTMNSRVFDFTPECAGTMCTATQTCDRGACVDVPTDGSDGGTVSSGSGGQTAASGGQAGAVVAATGGTSASGGAGMGSGGATASGGTGGASPTGGAGGSVAACQANATQCSTNGLQTCGGNGQWGMAMPCGPNQACTGAVGSAKCACASACTAGVIECASSTTLGSCAAGPNSCNLQSTTACGGGLVCERIAPASCADPNWAQWPVPPTLSPAGYMDHEDGTVTDIITRLMWEKANPTAAMTQPEAVTYCATARTGGYSDWRLPTKIELLSLVDYGAAFLSPHIHPVFTGATGAYWSSTPNLMTSSPWTVEFASGSATSQVAAGKSNVRCVR